MKHENRANIFDNEFAAPPYRRRLAKYMKRGFGVYIPRRLGNNNTTQHTTAIRLIQGYLGLFGLF